MIADIFYIVLFVTAFGSIAWLFVMFSQNILKVILPFSICSAMVLLFALPTVIPGVFIIAPNTQWLDKFIIASTVWAALFSVFFIFMIVKAFITILAIKRFPLCADEKILNKVKRLSGALHIRKLPEVRFGTLKQPACAASIFFPKVILNEHIIDNLSDEELDIILLHELVHIKRKHLLMQRVFDLICCFHWFNPICWLAQHEYYLSCELDCDQKTIAMIQGSDSCAYANTMIKLMQFSVLGKKQTIKNTGLLDFIHTKRRLAFMLSQPLWVTKAAAVIIALIIFLGAIGLSIAGSRGYFHPYPANQTQTKWSETSEYYTNKQCY
ncbi:M56 family metallopeptidase [Desnuesiella massiliensis]|uniref:M56 family metallopeptidase n=1 Tax=Desnuesiella massiliensis TaxID=1650662 RepID=UPI0006E44EA1|nr:M56 family metallopeptidase [Desnuesiella massiliensis]